VEIAKHRFPFSSRGDSWKLVPLGDVHLGAKGCDERAFDAKVMEIAKDKRALTLLMGDMCDCITPGDKRWDDRAVADWCYEPWARSNIAIAQRDRLVNSLQHIPRERILGIISGNHEATIRRYHSLDITLDIARTLGIKYLGEEAFVHLTFEWKGCARTFVIFATHGSGGGRKVGGKANKMTDIAAFVDADITCMGHHHDRLGVRTVRLGLDKNANFTHTEQVHVLTGSYLKTYQVGSPSYAARELYPPTAIGSPTVLIRPQDRHLEVRT